MSGPSPSPSTSLALSDPGVVVVAIDPVAALLVAVLRNVAPDGIGDQTHVGPAEIAWRTLRAVVSLLSLWSYPHKYSQIGSAKRLITSRSPQAFGRYP